jgi:hypothetical protein
LFRDISSERWFQVGSVVQVHQHVGGYKALGVANLAPLVGSSSDIASSAVDKVMLSQPSYSLKDDIKLISPTLWGDPHSEIPKNTFLRPKS